jgi:spore maturation protein CgeB
MMILFVGPLDVGSTSLQRYNAVKKLYSSSKSVNILKKTTKNIIYNFYLYFLTKIGFPKDISNANQNIIVKIKKYKPNIIWLDKANTIKANTLLAIKRISKKTKILGYSPDYMTRFVNRSHYFTKAIKYYDTFFTTKSYGVNELKKIGAKRVFFINNSFDPKTHRKIYLSNNHKSKFKSAVGFIGTWEKERAEYMYAVACSGILVKWWGSVSNRHFFFEKFYNHPNLIKNNNTIVDKEYTKAINSFDIALCFLRRDNKDLQTTRSVEIPACGTFMLAQRTKEHQMLFKEGKEAEFFSSKDELIKKIDYYLKNEKERIKIAEAGRKRCQKSGYSNYTAIRNILRVSK